METPSAGTPVGAAGGALTGIRCTSGLMMGGSGPISVGLVGAGAGGTGGHSPVPLNPVGSGVDDGVDGVGIADDAGVDGGLG